MCHQETDFDKNNTGIKSVLICKNEYNYAKSKLNLNKFHVL